MKRIMKEKPGAYRVLLSRLRGCVWLFRLRKPLMEHSMSFQSDLGLADPPVHWAETSRSVPASNATSDSGANKGSAKDSSSQPHHEGAKPSQNLKRNPLSETSLRKWLFPQHLLSRVILCTWSQQALEPIWVTVPTHRHRRVRVPPHQHHQQEWDHQHRAKRDISQGHDNHRYQQRVPKATCIASTDMGI